MDYGSSISWPHGDRIVYQIPLLLMTCMKGMGVMYGLIPTFSTLFRSIDGALLTLITTFGNSMYWGNKGNPIGGLNKYHRDSEKGTHSRSIGVVYANQAHTNILHKVYLEEYCVMIPRYKFKQTSMQHFVILLSRWGSCLELLDLETLSHVEIKKVIISSLCLPFTLTLIIFIDNELNRFNNAMLIYPSSALSQTIMIS